MQVCHFIMDYYDLKGHWLAEEKKRIDMAVRLKETGPGQKMVEASLKHYEAEQG